MYTGVRIVEHNIIPIIKRPTFYVAKQGVAADFRNIYRKYYIELYGENAYKEIEDEISHNIGRYLCDRVVQEDDYYMDGETGTICIIGVENYDWYVEKV